MLAYITPGLTVGVTIATPVTAALLSSLAVEKPVTRYSLKGIEFEHERRVPEATGGHKGKACEIPGVSRPRLQRMLSQFEADAE